MQHAKRHRQPRQGKRGNRYMHDYTQATKMYIMTEYTKQKHAYMSKHKHTPRDQEAASLREFREDCRPPCFWMLCICFQSSLKHWEG